ncbi:transmembrane protein 241 [Kryptolebias marmoratus]|uniref:Transmembrane protein 241 n=1 Tax=Kryptolebias marmoratus TaxID=37003 RepID=A0A3Q3B409_KRYMA|nr:transmembrane protein 241 [Kryptolebias marmoratus]
MQWRSHITGLAFTFVFVAFYFTNKFVLSVLKFTYPTLFQGWQTLIEAFLLLLAGKLGWVEISRISRPAVLSWLPGSFLFVGNIYAGSRALSRIDIPFFFTLQNSSHVVTFVVLKVLRRDKTPWLKLISVCLLLLSAASLLPFDPQFDRDGYLWALCHLSCVGAYRVFQVHHKSNNLSDMEQQCVNYLLSVALLGLAAHPTGDLTGAFRFPSLRSRTFHCGCCASAVLGFLLLLASVKLKRGLSVQHFRVWLLLSKVTAAALSPLLFNMAVSGRSLSCVVFSHVGEVLLIHSEKDSQLER